jgi:dihydrofolate reductase
VNSQSKIFVEKSLEIAVKFHFNSEQNIFVIGGLQLYTEALPWVNTIYATVFDDHYICDKYLPLKYLNQHFDITNGTKQDSTFFVTLSRVR